MIGHRGDPAEFEDAETGHYNFAATLTAHLGTSGRVLRPILEHQVGEFHRLALRSSTMSCWCAFGPRSMQHNSAVVQLFLTELLRSVWLRQPELRSSDLRLRNVRNRGGAIRDAPLG
jgi:hypothetical protein